MRDRGRILLGLAAFLALELFPIWYNLGSGGSVIDLEIELPEGGGDCIADTEFMRHEHMQLLMDWRDEVVRDNDRVYTAEDGKQYYTVDADVILPDTGKKTKSGVIRLQFSEPAAAIKMWLTVTFFGGLLLSLPFVVFFIGLFVMPGVRDVERKLMSRISVFSGGLFLAGIYMGYKVTLPLALGLMLKIGGQLGGESIWFYNKYIGFALQLLLGFGVAFQLPVIILILGKMGLVSSKSLRFGRPYVIVGIFVLAMVLTPPDVMTQVLMAAPLIFLYEFCIWFLHFSGNRELPPKDDDAEETPDDPEPDEPTVDTNDPALDPANEPEDDENEKPKDLTKE